MIKKFFTGKIAHSSRYAIVFLVFFIASLSSGYSEKKGIPGIAGFENIDPFDEKALDFLDRDYDSLRRQAVQFVREKKYFEAAQCYLALLKVNLNDPTTIYNLACCYGRLRRPDAAVKSLCMAVMAGFRDFALLRRDPDFTQVRDTPQFANLLERVEVWEDNLGEVLYMKASKLAEVLVKVPKKIAAARTYPLLIGLHGRGDCSERMLSVLYSAFKNEPLILAAPQGAYANLPQLRGQHFTWDIQTANRELWKAADPLAVENVNLAIQALKEKYPVSEVYILGFSQGAIYAFLSAFKYPGLVAGVISIGGTLPQTGKEYSILTEAEIEKGEKIRVFIAQGRTDPSFPAGTGAQAAEKLKQYGYEAEYQEYEGGHEITPELLKKIYSWMAKK